MYIFVIIWILFIFVYILLNAYGVFRVIKMRIKGDIIPAVAIVYILIITIVIMLALIFIGMLDWGKSLADWLG